ncbi:MAG: SAM-dependent methyltransferase [Actinobacteria bacterium]|nr:SAM-dependent methyltransferase [Actinomycetota bacterium]
MNQPSPEHATKINFGEPHAARVWNYWLGGKDNYPADREAGDAVAAVYPAVVNMATQSRQFLIRAVRWLAAEAGIRQFLDIGTGLPTMQNTHEVAQSAAADSKIVYVDNDPLVLAHARALLTNTTPEGVTQYIHADFHEPERIISGARGILNFDQPIAVMFMGVLGLATDYDAVRSIVATVMDTTPAGSYLVLWDMTSTSEAAIRAGETYARSGAVPYVMRGYDQVRDCFEGLELVEPGFVSITLWRPNTRQIGTVEPIDAYGGVARKPSA